MGSTNSGNSVDHPPHYNSHPSGVECIEITEHYNFCVGNAIKYVWRAGLKVPTGPSRYRWPGKGRRADRNEMEARRRVLVRDTHDTSRLVKMAPRDLRREKQGDNFRPVYYHGIPIKVSHKSVVSAMKVHKKGRRQAQRWQSHVNIGHAFVSFRHPEQLTVVLDETAACNAKGGGQVGYP